ncbi:hypothetical protein EXIGLDRAFT_635815 [Exidia glandulosa HHB12029]|uniref:HIG1 domain-containing protein n=1 Tax=Exidia glandulosa HHB12029 TaxID=1314781 RepID=A0A165QZX8_EXIGL|nr:hypothetical protein EXIGLDRAFT_635815 [Exidia glandulosa HHB12029]
MKIVTAEEIRQHQRETLKGGAVGLGVGAAIGAPTLYAANRFFPAYRALPPSLKVFSAIAFVVPAAVIQAERAGLAFERAQWNDLGEHELERRAEFAKARWDSLGDTEKARDWASRHKFGIVGGGWVAGMAAASAIIMRDPLQTFPQKLVQARMWAQGWTIALVIGAAMVSRTPVRDHAPVDHSWRSMIAEAEEEQKMRAAPK